jgi:hypothetical protein
VDRAIRRNPIRQRTDVDAWLGNNDDVRLLDLTADSRRR